jgi:hypothetical protein
LTAWPSGGLKKNGEVFLGIAWPSDLKARFSRGFGPKLFSKKIKKGLHPQKKLISCPALFLREKGR